MPAIPNLVLTTDNVSVADLAAGGFFRPAAAGGSLEQLNGGLDHANYDGDPLPSWTFRYGTHFCGGSWGSNRREYTMRQQRGGNDTATDSQHVVFCGLGSRVMLPWDAKVFMWGLSAWCCQDTTAWDGGNKLEHWDWQVYLDETRLTYAKGKLPPARRSTDQPDASPLLDDPGVAAENRWRYVSTFGLHKNVDKGEHIVKLSTWAGILAPDQLLAKLIVPSWHFWIVGIR